MTPSELCEPELYVAVNDKTGEVLWKTCADALMVTVAISSNALDKSWRRLKQLGWCIRTVKYELGREIEVELE